MTYREQINYDDMSSALREAGVSFEDTTWGNDVTASISVLLDTGCGLHFEEEFAVTLIEQGRTCDFRRPEEVIDYLQSFTN